MTIFYLGNVFFQITNIIPHDILQPEIALPCHKNDIFFYICMLVAPHGFDLNKHFPNINIKIYSGYIKYITTDLSLTFLVQYWIKCSPNPNVV